MKPPKKRNPILPILLFFIATTLPLSLQQNDDASVMLALRAYLTNPPTSWTGSDPCNPEWAHIQCSTSNRIIRIQIGNLKLQSQGTLPSNLSTLTQLTVLELMGNSLGGPLPSLAGLSSLQTLNLHSNSFSYIPPDIFQGMTSLTFVSLDKNPFSPWQVPESLKDASSLQQFSANFANLTGSVPEWLNTQNFPSLVSLHLAGNSLQGGLPDSFSGSSINSLWLNGQNPRMNGSILVLGNMTELTEVWLNLNSFTGPLPDFSRLTVLQNLTIRDNLLTGPVPDSLTGLTSLLVVNLTNNRLQGPAPEFRDSVQVDMTGLNQFCNNTPGSSCSYFVNVLLDVAKGFGYPLIFGEKWNGNDPCNNWQGISCSNGNITVINFMNMGLSGVISPNFSMIPTLQKLLLSNNAIWGTIPDSLTNLNSLTLLDVSNNMLSGQVPQFRPDVQVKTTGNLDIGKNSSGPSTPGKSPGVSPSSPAGSSGGSGGGSSGSGSGSNMGKIVGPVIGVIGALVVGLGVLYFRKKRKTSSKVRSPNMVVIHPRHSNEDGVKITVAGSSASAGGSETHTNFSSGPSDVQVVEAGNMVISIQVLRDVTNNFDQANILGRGGFGTVYKGELHDGTKIAVKRMESGLVTDKGLTEFQAEIAVLTKVRHRHLVALLGYCLDGNEKLLVYEYMPQGTLSEHLFYYKEQNRQPLEWTRRLIVALDVARGVEYLHGLAHQTFIHRDLKPSNILLGDDMRAKVADFGLVRLAPEGKASIATKLAGTFGYLAPEYAVTGRVTTKIDVFSFGVILMEMITGRKALDESRPEDSMHLVTWFRRMHINKDTFRDTIDKTIEINEETLASVTKVAELASHCTAREPYQRPDMGHAVNVLSSLVELWKPAEVDSDDAYGIDFDMTLPQALKKWQEFEGSNVDDSSLLGSNDNTQTSIPARPTGFADSFKSADGR